jgi:hypothetical protein
VLRLYKERRERGQTIPYRRRGVFVDLGLAPVELERALFGDARVNTVGAVIVHSGVGLQIHLAKDLREFEESFGKEKQKHLAAFARVSKIRE